MQAGGTQDQLGSQLRPLPQNAIWPETNRRGGKSIAFVSDAHALFSSRGAVARRQESVAGVHLPTSRSMNFQVAIFLWGHDAMA